MTGRADWDTYFMNIATEVAVRSTCERKHVGAVIVCDREIVSTGYNGSVRRLPHCDDVGHLMEDGHCVRTVHAELNAILSAARRGLPVAGARIYVTALPCWPCFQALANADIRRIMYGEAYRPNVRVIDAAKELGIKMLPFPPIADHTVCEDCGGDLGVEIGKLDYHKVGCPRFPI
jgi:dCMP deaminase